MIKEVRDLVDHDSFANHRIRMLGSHCSTQNLTLRDAVPKTAEGQAAVMLFEDVPPVMGRLHKAILWVKSAGATATAPTDDYYPRICTDTSWTEASSFATMDALSFTDIPNANINVDPIVFVVDEWWGWDVTGNSTTGVKERYEAGATSFTIDIEKDDVGTPTEVSAGDVLSLGVLRPVLYTRTDGSDAPFLATYGEGF